MLFTITGNGNSYKCTTEARGGLFIVRSTRLASTWIHLRSEFMSSSIVPNAQRELNGLHLSGSRSVSFPQAMVLVYGMIEPPVNCFYLCDHKNPANKTSMGICQTLPKESLE